MNHYLPSLYTIYLPTRQLHYAYVQTVNSSMSIVALSNPITSPNHTHQNTYLSLNKLETNDFWIRVERSKVINDDLLRKRVNMIFSISVLTFRTLKCLSNKILNKTIAACQNFDASQEKKDIELNSEQWTQNNVAMFLLSIFRRPISEQKYEFLKRYF